MTEINEVMRENYSTNRAYFRLKLYALKFTLNENFFFKVTEFKMRCLKLPLCQ